MNILNIEKVSKTYKEKEETDAEIERKMERYIELQEMVDTKTIEE